MFLRALSSLSFFLLSEKVASFHSIRGNWSQGQREPWSGQGRDWYR